MANTSNQRQSFQASFRQTGLQAERWNPLDGRIRPLAIAPKTDKTSTVSLDLAGYDSTIVVFTSRQLPAVASGSVPPALDVSAGWNVTFAAGPGGSGSPVTMDPLANWTTLPGMANYSGVATYQKKVTISADLAGATAVMTFGLSTPAPVVASRGTTKASRRR